MKHDIEDSLDLFSPLIDNLVNKMSEMKLNQSEYIALGFLVCAEFSMRSALKMPIGEEGLDQIEREQLNLFINEKRKEADEIIQLALKNSTMIN